MLIHPYTATKNVYLSEEVVPTIVRALRDLVEGRTTEVLLNRQCFEQLQLLGPFKKAMVLGGLLRRDSSPSLIAVNCWERNWEDDG